MFHPATYSDFGGNSIRLGTISHNVTVNYCQKKKKVLNSTQPL